jgi:hypothetical protein
LYECISLPVPVVGGTSIFNHFRDDQRRYAGPFV